MIFAGEEWLAFQHLRENAARAPNVHLDVVFLPCKHDLWSAIVSSGNVAGHLRILDSSKAKVANFEVAVFVDQDIAGLEISVDDAGAVNVFQTSLENMLACPLFLNWDNEPKSGRGNTG